MGVENQVLIVLANLNFQDIEYNYVKDALTEAGIEQKISALTLGSCKGISGTEVEPNYTPGEVEVAEYDAIIFIGGTGVEQYLHEIAYHDLAKAFLVSGKIVAAICWAPAILANAGILNGKKATAWSGAKDDLISKGAIYTTDHVVVDGKIITADGPDYAKEFGEKIAEMISQTARSTEST